MHSSGTYPFLDKLKPKDFARLLALGEIALGSALLLPVIPAAVAGTGLAAFSGGLLGRCAGPAVIPAAADGIPPHTVVRDTVPLGEAAIRRGEPVHATDGDIGKVQGLVIERGSRHITHVLLQHGHLWGRKEVAIPISAVASTSEGIKLTISKQVVQDLPPVDIDHRV